MQESSKIIIKRVLWGVAAAAVVGSAAVLITNNNPVAGAQAGYAAWKMAGFLVTGNHQHLVPAAFMGGIATQSFFSGSDLVATIHHLLSLKAAIPTLLAGGAASMHAFFSSLQNMAEDVVTDDGAQSARFRLPERNFRSAASKNDLRKLDS